MAASRVEPERRVVAEIVAVLAGLGVNGFARRRTWSAYESGSARRRNQRAYKRSHWAVPHDLGELLAIVGSFWPSTSWRQKPMTARVFWANPWCAETRPGSTSS